MRLLEVEVRMASITGCAPGPSRTTQASNFSCCRRAAELAGISTGSMPNCLKQSVRMVRVLSLRSTRAMRAAACLVWGIGAKAVPKALSIDVGKPRRNSYSGVKSGFGKGSFGLIFGYKSVTPGVALVISGTSCNVQEGYKLGGCRLS